MIDLENLLMWLPIAMLILLIVGVGVRIIRRYSDLQNLPSKNKISSGFKWISLLMISIMLSGLVGLIIFIQLYRSNR